MSGLEEVGTSGGDISLSLADDDQVALLRSVAPNADGNTSEVRFANLDSAVVLYDLVANDDMTQTDH